MRAIQRLENFRRKPLRDKWFAVKATLKRFAVKATHVQLGRGVRRATNCVYVTLNDRHVRRQIFREIYEGGLWGSDAHSKFFSGVGSRGKCAELYVAKMVQLLREHAAELGRPLTVVDLGCGDFQIGRALLAELPDFDYVGCDIVPELVEHNNRVYANEHVKFCQLDIVSEALPVGDVCLVRQVLQHLPNADIQKFLQKAIFPYLYVTEGQPSVRVGPFNPDINTGVGLRFDWLSGRGRGVELDKPPYCLKTQEAFRTSERVNEIIVTERIFVGEAGLPLAN